MFVIVSRTAINLCLFQSMQQVGQFAFGSKFDRSCINFPCSVSEFNGHPLETCTCEHQGFCLLMGSLWSQAIPYQHCISQDV